MDLATILSGLAAGTLSVPAIGWLLNHLPQLNKGQKRSFAIAFTFAIGIGAYLLSIVLGFVPLPYATVEAWFDQLWPVCMASFTASQAVLAGLRSETVTEALTKTRGLAQ